MHMHYLHVYMCVSGALDVGTAYMGILAECACDTVPTSYCLLYFAIHHRATVFDNNLQIPGKLRELLNFLIR